MTVDDFLKACAYEVEVGFTAKYDPVIGCSIGNYEEKDFIAPCYCAGDYLNRKDIKNIYESIKDKEVHSFRNTYDLHDFFDGIIVAYKD